MRVQRNAARTRKICYPSALLPRVDYPSKWKPSSFHACTKKRGTVTRSRDTRRRWPATSKLDNFIDAREKEIDGWMEGKRWETLEGRPNARFPFSGHKSKSVVDPRSVPRHPRNLHLFHLAPCFLRWLRVRGIFLRRKVNNEHSKWAAIRSSRGEGRSLRHSKSFLRPRRPATEETRPRSRRFSLSLSRSLPHYNRKLW